MREIKTTTGVCSQCLTKVPATVVEVDGEIVMDKTCPTHGVERALLATDPRFYYQSAQAPSNSSCCASNHSCTLIFEITEKCNLSCPTCFAGSSPQQTWKMSLEELEEKIDRLHVAGKSAADIVQLSGGEPTIHPQIEEMIELCFRKGIKKVYVNTNGLRLAQEPDFAKRLAKYSGRLQFYLQFDGFRAETHQLLRSAKGLLKVKRRALANACAANLFVLPVMTVTPGVNVDEIGQMVQLILENHPEINTLMLQPAMYAGRYDNEQHYRRLTVGDVAAEVVKQTDGMFSLADFGPIPCSHPNCFSMAVGLITGERVIPISRYFPAFETWGDPGVADRIELFTDKMPMNMVDVLNDDKVVDELFDLLSGDEENMLFGNFKNFLLICIKPFMDAHTYDQDRVDRCCVHVVNRAGDPVSLCEYNSLQRPRGIV